MERPPEFLEQLDLDAIELPELVVFGDPAEDRSRVRTPAVEYPKDGARGLEFIIHVANLARFGVQVTGAWIAGFEEEGGTDMP